MDDNVDRKTKENDKIYKIIFEKKNTRTNIRMGINLGIIVIIALIEKYRKEDIKRKEQNKRK